MHCAASANMLLKHWWSCVIILGISNLCPSFAKPPSLRCYKSSSSLDDYDVANLDTAESLLNSTCYDSSKLCNFLFTYGFNGSAQSNNTVAVLSTFLEKYYEQCNAFLLDWEDQARSINYLGAITQSISYLNAYGAMTEVANSLADAFLRMSNYNFNLDETYLMGHSLGAQLIGEASRLIKSQGKEVKYITALDAARPGFEPPVIPCVGSGDANFVVMIYSDPGGYGVANPHGTVNIHLNCQNFESSGSKVQPGCPVVGFSFDLLSADELCSHNFSWRVQVDAWKNGNLFAVYADSCADWMAGNANYSNVVNISNVSTIANGNYFVITNSQSPYGRGQAGLYYTTQ